MNNEDKIVKLKLDVIFKRVFGDENDTDIIAAFVSALLEIPQESIRNIFIRNTELTPDYFKLKELSENNLNIYTCLICPVCRYNTLKYVSIPAVLCLTQNKLSCV